MEPAVRVRDYRSGSNCRRAYRSEEGFPRMIERNATPSVAATIASMVDPARGVDVERSECLPFSGTEGRSWRGSVVPIQAICSSAGPPTAQNPPRLDSVRLLSDPD